MKLKYLISVMFSSAAILSGILNAPVSATDEFQSKKDEIVMIVNEQRIAQGKEPIFESALLNQAADIRAKEIISNFSHTRPNGGHGYEAVKEVGGTYMAVGENIAYGYSTEADVMDGWMNSTGHRKNILNESYQALGVGVAYQNGMYYWVQLFTDGIGLTSMYATGNLNQDDAINSEDAALILSDSAQVGAGASGTLTRLQRSYADLNQDGKVNSSDAAIILEYSAYMGAGGSESIESYLKQ